MPSGKCCTLHTIQDKIREKAKAGCYSQPGSQKKLGWPGQSAQNSRWRGEARAALTNPRAPPGSWEDEDEDEERKLLGT